MDGLRSDLDYREPWFWLSLVQILAGLWLLGSAVALGYAFDVPAALMNEIAAGVLVTSLGVTSLFLAGTWSNWLTGLVAGFLIVAPLLRNYEGRTAAYVNDIGVGVLLLALSVLIGLSRTRANGAAPAGAGTQPSS